MDDWGEMTEEQRQEAFDEWLRDILNDMGLDGDNFDIKYEPNPENPDRKGAYDTETDTIYIHPDNFEGDYSENSDEGEVDAMFDANAAQEVGAEEARHAQQDDVYNDYGIDDSTWADQGFREEDARDFADSYVPDPEDCPEEEPESSGGDDDMPPPPSPAGDFPLPAGDTAYA